MVKVVLVNNGGAVEKIADETKTVRTILEENAFTYANATLNIDGRSVPGDLLDTPLEAFMTGGSSTVRITAVAHKANA